MREAAPNLVRWDELQRQPSRIRLRCSEEKEMDFLLDHVVK